MSEVIRGFIIPVTLFHRTLTSPMLQKLLGTISTKPQWRWLMAETTLSMVEVLSGFKYHPTMYHHRHPYAS